MNNGTTQQVAFRLSKALLGRLDKHVERMQRAQPGVSITRADAVRLLLTRALDDAEARPR